MMKNSALRHPGESRDPVFEMDVDGNFTDWIPAFAGMTSKSVFVGAFGFGVCS
jgi:hypothetical protein